MSTVVRTEECYPGTRLDCLGLDAMPRPVPRHEDCPGGHHISGVLGGWHCPCQCHASSPDVPWAQHRYETTVATVTP